MIGVRMEWRESLDLEAQIGTGVDKEPIDIVGRERQLSLRSRATVQPALTQPPAIRAGAIPLRKSSTCGCTKDPDVHPRLDLRICVARDLAAQGHFFELRLRPFHNDISPYGSF